MSGHGSKPPVRQLSRSRIDASKAISMPPNRLSADIAIRAKVSTMRFCKLRPLGSAVLILSKPEML